MESHVRLIAIGKDEVRRRISGRCPASKQIAARSPEDETYPMQEETIQIAVPILPNLHSRLWSPRVRHASASSLSTARRGLGRYLLDIRRRCGSQRRMASDHYHRPKLDLLSRAGQKKRSNLAWT